MSSRKIAPIQINVPARMVKTAIPGKTQNRLIGIADAAHVYGIGFEDGLREAERLLAQQGIHAVFSFLYPPVP
jgi:ABC-type arginine transport system permease subunit